MILWQAQLSKLRKSSKHRGSSLNRKIGNLRPGKTILIACEGQKTEYNYFKAIKKEYRIAALTIKRGSGKSPLNIVQEAIKFVNDQRSKGFTFDEKWCVFDTEEPEISAIVQEAIKIGRENGFNLALTNPAFEFWYLLHYEKTTRLYSNCDEVIKDLKKYIPSYEKNFEDFTDIFSRMDDALNHAEEILAQHAKDNAEEFPNPCSHVHHLVKVLRNLQNPHLR
jgi:hypothetical protein